METRILSGKDIAEQIRSELKNEIERLKAEHNIVPGLATVLVGDDPASQVYVRNKTKACEKIGINSYQYNLPKDTNQDELLGLIEQLNSDEKVNGILVQLPLPGHIDSSEVLDAISPQKDVDGFHPLNVGLFMTEKNFSDMIKKGLFLPCTPHGCIEILMRSGIEIAGKRAVVVGRSNIVGKPVSLLLLSCNATVTVCHSRTKNLADVTKEADILIAAIGKPKFITADMIKDGAVVIDVGVNRTDEGLVGDVDFEEASKKASAITPVPGGVGPMTITMLLVNTVKAAKRHHNILR
jgi:methylenetetrahydrofolate dehydrogenase (NADP+)/methenyltetrahydrofolate cyclohydrolase